MKNTGKLFMAISIFMLIIFGGILPNRLLTMTCEAAEYTGSWVKKTNGLYWQQEDGTILRKGGWHVLNGQRYFLASKSGRMKTGWITWRGMKYYLDPETGVLATGITEINGSFYYFDEERKIPGRMCTGLIDANGKRYFAKKNGKLAAGWRNIKGKKYFFDSDRAAVSGWKIIDGKRYYFDKKGCYIRTGWLTKGKKKYYLNKDGTPVIGRKTIKGNSYLFKEPYGVMATGWQSENDHQYYDNPDGKMAVGVQSVDGVRYIFNTTKGYLETGWKTVDGYKYYAGKDGIVRTGLQKIGKKNYLFSEDGALITNQKVVEYGGKYYAVDSNGVATETVTIRGKVHELTWQFINAHSSPAMSNAERFRACFNWLEAYLNYKAGRYHMETFDHDDWQYEIALECLETGPGPAMIGNCYHFACTVASIAKELGYSPRVIITDGDHGFVMINGGYYDNMGALFGAVYHTPYNVWKTVMF